jgi:hypothetical protein
MTFEDPMVPVLSQWLPILLSTAAVWISSMIVWTMMPYHRSDYRAFPDEEAVRKALQPQNLGPGLYSIPHLASRADLGKPEVQRLFDDGPAGFMTVLSRGAPKLKRALVLAFLFYWLVSGSVAYIASRTLAPGAEFLLVFQVTGTVAWLAYGMGAVPAAIWFGRPWKDVAKQLLDAFIYGVVTAAVFASQWPQ